MLAWPLQPNSTVALLIFCSFAGGLEPLGRQICPVLGEKLAHCGRHGQEDVSVNVDLGLNRLLDLFH
jgi:hypothetical protein